MVEVWEVLLVLLAATSAVFVGAHLLACYLRRAKFVRMVNKLPGPPAYPIFGCCLEFMGLPKHRMLEAYLERNKKYGPIFRGWVGPMPVVNISDPEYLEVLLSSPKHLEKGYLYQLLHPWLGTGLLTSTGDKWRRHRKLITPAFHFSILHNFVEVFAEKSEVLVHILQRHADGTPFDVFPLVARCALDIICETAMGTKINAQDEKESEYVTALYGVSEEVLYRTLRPWLHPDCVYFRLPCGKRMKKHLAVIHGFAYKVRPPGPRPKQEDSMTSTFYGLSAVLLLARGERKHSHPRLRLEDETTRTSSEAGRLYDIRVTWAECSSVVSACNRFSTSNIRCKEVPNRRIFLVFQIIAEKKSKLAANATAEQLGQETVEGKKRAAFLDLLLQASSKEVMSDEELREEVDTFMFEGYDTTTVAITWSLFLLGLHPDVQARVAEEQHGIFAGSERTASMQDLQDMQYLGQVIKEALRLYPSVHSVSRRAACDLQFGQYTVPAGCTVSALIYNTHRNERHFPDPDKFNPENFSTERVRARHPYAYVPFSAGPRNCIGQKFAMLEEKMVLSSVLRRYELRSVEPEQGNLVAGEMILRPAAGVKLALTPRVWVSPS
ncbi:cytochrome P450 4C1-like [Bacillus rossius redtenbacheri]|uniref:cytochrome P450 4C1-like n=1 Tax=Bacillus rossius redtenbacheri TaxID=93214 RepID=UPI002FDE3C75